MAKKKKIDIKQVIADALEHYHNYVRPSIQESTKRQNESLLSEFYRFVDTLPARDKTMKIFSQKGLNRYKEYLIDKMERSKTDGKKRNFGVGQLNRCGSIIARLINNVLYPKEIVPNHVVWIKVEDTRRESQKGHIPLLDNEVTAIENCKGLTPVEEEYRNIFLLQIESGQRVSDLANILTGEYTLGQVDEYECIILATKKEDVPAAVVLTPKVRMLLERIKTHKHVDPKKFKEKADSKGNNTYNEAIRRIAKKAGLDRIIVKIDTNKIVEKKPEKKPLYKVITNHDARSTFITNKIRAGMTPDEIAVFTGHANGEMIRRVYAQPTIEDKLRNVKQYLSGGENEKDANSHANTLSNNPKEHNADVPPEAQPRIYTPNDFDPNTFFESEESIAFDKYIHDLNDLVDEAINEMNSYQLYVDDIEIFCQTILDGLKQRIKLSKQEIEIEVKSQIQSQKNDSSKLSQMIESAYDKVVNNAWQIIESSLEEEKMEDEYFDDPRVYDLIRLCLLRAWNDYLKEDHFDEGVIESLEEKFKSICEENPSLFIAYREMPNAKVVWPIQKFWIVLIKMELFMLDNRPIATESIIKEDNRAYRFLTDWRFVFRELQRTPAMTLETLIQNTKCGDVMKSVLYNSIKDGDFERFYEIIKEHGHEVRLLINYCYSSQYFRMCAQSTDYLFRESINGVDIPLEKIKQYEETILRRNPFVERGHDESPDFFKKDILKRDKKEISLWLLDGSLKAFDESNDFIFPSEREVYNKVFNLVDFNKHPELKKAYDEYKAKQKAESKQTDVEAKIVSEEDRIENRKKVSSQVNYLPVNSQDLDIDKFIRLLTEKDKLNKYHQFIAVLESTDNVDVATCLKHFLNTRSTSPLSFTLKWNGNSMVSLKFLIRLIANTNEDATRDNVIEKQSKKAFDGISKNVSKWKGSGDLWTPVYNVFEGCTSSIFSAALGEEGSDARAINLNELETIADIYFECKK